MSKFDAEAAHTAASEDQVPGRLRGILRAIAVVALAVIAIGPAMKVGFLADDFYIIRRIAEIADANPGSTVAQLRDGVFVFRRWSHEFQAFRPLTIATLQIDYALHGIDARGFRATNIGLWILGALLFSAVCKAYLGVDSPCGRVATFLACAWWPVAVEPLGWTVIRQDALLVDAALAGALILRRKRRLPWLVTAPLLAGLASKETAIVLPVAFAAIDGALLRREGVPPRRILGTVARRAWPWFLAVAAWWIARKVGGAGEIWAGRSYPGVLLSLDAPFRMARGLLGGLRALLLPVNLSRDGSIVPVLFAAVSGVLALVASMVALRSARLVDVAAGAIWFFGPLLLLLPFYSVSPALESVRVVLLPGLVWLFAAVAGAARIARARPRVALLASLAFLAAEVVVLRFDLGAFVNASARVERICSDAREWSAGTVHVLRARHDDALVPSLLIHEGVYVFSAIDDTLGPPFLSARIHFVPLAEEDEQHLSALVRDETKRGMIAALVHESGGPRFRLLADRALGAQIVLVPAHEATVGRGDSPIFAVTVPSRLVEVGDTCVVIVADPTGNRVEARRVVDAGGPSFGQTRMEFGARDFGLSESSAPLAQVGASIFIWSATLIRDGAPIARSPYAVVNIADDG